MTNFTSKNFKTAVAEKFNHKMNRYEIENGVARDENKKTYCMVIKHEGANYVNTQYFEGDRYIAVVGPDNMAKYIETHADIVTLFKSGIHIESRTKTVRRRIGTTNSFKLKQIETQTPTQGVILAGDYTIIDYTGDTVIWEKII